MGGRMTNDKLDREGARLPEGVVDLEAERERREDHVVRGTAADGMVRAFAITARATVEEARVRHNTTPVATAALGRLIMGAQMMGAMSKNDDELVTITVMGDGELGRITVTADNRGHAKGFVQNPRVWLPLNGRGHLDVGQAVGAGTLSVVHDVAGMDPYSSEVELVSGEIGDDLTYYFAASDQIPTSLGVGVLVDRDMSVRRAGGFVIQLMPGCDEDVVAALEANLAPVHSVTDLLEAGMTPTEMLQHLLQGLDYQELDRMPASFRCGCDRSRAMRAVLALGRAELGDMVEKGEPAQVHCHFCGADYRFEPTELAKMLCDAGAPAPEADI